MTSLSVYLLCLFMTANAVVRHAYVMDKRWICNVKKSCVECLNFAHCSWCANENKCFSKELPFEEFESKCQNSTIDHVEYGLSIEENAECSCGHGKIERQCYPPGVTEGVQCSGRGICLCGRCMCDSTPDLDHPTKMVMGEYCEFDNFSCDRPDCNEGPYSRSTLVTPVDDDATKMSAKTADPDIPV